jgi:hypothetical protein
MPGQTRKDGTRSALFHVSCYLCCSVVVLFCVLFVCKCVLPPGDNTIAVNIYIITSINVMLVCSMGVAVSEGRTASIFTVIGTVTRRYRGGADG